MPTSIAALPPTFTTGTARGLGVHPRDLYRWRDRGEVIELSRGVFRRSDAPVPSYPDALGLAHRAPRAVICCTSAAMVHELTDELPGTVQIAVPQGAHVPQIDHPPTTVFRFDPDTFTIGLTDFEAAPGEPVRIYDPARTVVDLMRLRHRLSESVAYSALRRYLGQTGARPATLLDYAERLDVFGPMRTALDIATAQ